MRLKIPNLLRPEQVRWLSANNDIPAEDDLKHECIEGGRTTTRDQSRRTFLKTTVAQVATLVSYELVKPMVSVAAVEGDWHWCYKCQGLWFWGNFTFGPCPAGGYHSLDGSANYRLTTPPESGQRGDWRRCYKCQGLWLWRNGYPEMGVCPAGGTHSYDGSDDYGIDFNSGQQDNWRRCFKCKGLWFNGNPTNGVCSAGGSHKDSKENLNDYNYWLHF